MDINYKEILENLIHELARINSMIKTSAETISKCTKGNMDKNAIVHHSEIVLENSFLFSTQLDIVNYQLNPNYIFDVEKFDKRNIYGKFHKAIISFKRLAKEKQIKIEVRGSINVCIDSKPVIDTLPILILDNAIKYSPKGCIIEIEFNEDPDSIEVQVSNMGPYIAPNERDKIFNRGYRGKEATKTNTMGLGFGLNFIRLICKIHQASISVICSENICKIGNINYSEFKLKIVFPKQIKV